jgi:inner membrane protein involved in colicin E2 resistance
MHWGGIIFAAMVILFAVPFAVSHFTSADNPIRTGAPMALLVLVIVVALSLVVVNIVRAYGQLENHPVYWTLNIGLSVVFWVLLLRLSWTERRQRPR